jgi:hypothetical protein
MPEGIGYGRKKSGSKSPIDMGDSIVGKRRAAFERKAAVSGPGGLAGRTAATAPKKKSAAGSMKPAAKRGLAGRTPLATATTPKKKGAAGTAKRSGKQMGPELPNTYTPTKSETKRKPKRLPKTS